MRLNQNSKAKHLRNKRQIRNFSREINRSQASIQKNGYNVKFHLRTEKPKKKTKAKPYFLSYCDVIFDYHCKHLHFYCSDLSVWTSMPQQATPATWPTTQTWFFAVLPTDPPAPPNFPSSCQNVVNFHYFHNHFIGIGIATANHTNWWWPGWNHNAIQIRY